MKKTTTNYRRNYRGDWFKNGRFMRTQPPAKILKIAEKMSIECQIEVG